MECSGYVFGVRCVGGEVDWPGSSEGRGTGMSDIPETWGAFEGRGLRE